MRRRLTVFMFRFSGSSPGVWAGAAAIQVLVAARG